MKDSRAQGADSEAGPFPRRELPSHREEASGWKERWREFWSTPDPVLIDHGARGEAVVARIRLLVIGLILAMPVRNLLLEPESRENHVALAMASASMLLTVLLYILVSREVYRPWIGMLTSIFDGLVVSTGLVAFLVLDQPYTAVNSKVVFSAYFLALIGTCLRNDPRISVLSGLAILAEYGSVVWYADSRWHLNDPVHAPFVMGLFSWDAQIGRLIMLAAATFLCTAIVLRTRKLVLLSKHDPLTGLLNRAELEERLKEEAGRSGRRDTSYVVAMLDIDDFKKLNDTFGHKGGDLALLRVARVLRRNLRRSDAVARYGGDEFCVIVNESTEEDATRKLEQIFGRIHLRPLDLARRGPTIQVTLSAGVAVGSGPMDPFEVLDKADSRLFRAKERGGNCIVGPDDPA